MDIIPFIAINFITVMLASYFTAYLKEKGKNTATSEDIKDITKKIQEVESIFKEEHEKLINDLQFYREIKTSLKTEEYTSLIQAYEKYSLYISTISEIWPSNHDLESITKLEYQLENIYIQCSIADAKMRLFIHEEKIYSLVDDIKSLVHDFKYVTLQGLRQYVIISLEGKNNNLSTEQLTNNQVEYINSFSNEKLEKYKVLLSTYREFRSECYKYLSSILNS